MTADIIRAFPEPMTLLINEIDSALAQCERGRLEWIEGSLRLSAVFAKARDRFSSDVAFGVWLVENGRGLNDHDRAALIHFGRDLSLSRIVFEETTRSSYQLIWKDEKDRFANASKPTSEPTSIPELPVSTPVTGQTEEPEFQKPAITTPAEPVAAEPAETYSVPKKSKLQEKLGEKAAAVLFSRFKHAKMFNALIGEGKQTKECSALRYLATRCVEEDYPTALFTSPTWASRLLYPHLPQKLLDILPKKLGSLYQHHVVLIETEQRFMLTPEFGVSDPPLVAFNKAHEIYNALVNAKNGNTVDPSAIHRPTFDDNEGKPPVIVRGTQVWPPETGAGYRYDDLRCACGLIDDVLLTFKGPRDAPLTTQSLKLRHLMAWLPGGYNSVGATLEGTFKAMKEVVQAYGADKSEVMRPPLPSLKKLDEA